MLTALQLRTFKSEGVLILRGFFPSRNVDKWRRDIHAYFGDPLSNDDWREALKVHKSDDFRFEPDPNPDTYAALKVPYASLQRGKPWSGNNELIVRAGREDAPWLGARAPHLDFPVYAPIRTLANNVTYLTAVKSRGGAFMYWPRSHRAAWSYFREFPQDYLAQGERTQDEVFKRILGRLETGPEEFIGDPGDLMIWHSFTMHSASVNTREETRLALFGRWGVLVEDEPTYDFSQNMWNYWSC